MLIFVVLFFGLLTIIRIDLQEGSLQHASFYNQESCEETFTTSYVVTIVQADDTIHSIFANTLSPEPMTFTERLSSFYTYNKHLQQQPLVAGEEVRVPIKERSIHCEK